jgi:hypothetical protein
MRDAQSAWIKPRMVIVITPSNEMARVIWAMQTKQEDYRDPTPAESASATCSASGTDVGEGV